MTLKLPKRLDRESLRRPMTSSLPGLGAASPPAPRDGSHHPARQGRDGPGTGAGAWVSRRPIFRSCARYPPSAQIGPRPSGRPRPRGGLRSVGVRPTMGPSGEPWGRSPCPGFRRRPLRPGDDRPAAGEIPGELRFHSLSQLVAQIGKDVEAVRGSVSSRGRTREGPARLGLRRNWETSER